MKIEKHTEDITKVQRESAVWLGVVDISDHAPITLTVDELVKYTDGEFDHGIKRDGQALRFKGSPKLLNLNATNTRKLAEHGKVAADFAGKSVTLDVVRLEREFNGSAYGIRIVDVS